MPSHRTIPIRFATRAWLLPVSLLLTAGPLAGQAGQQVPAAWRGEAVKPERSRAGSSAVLRVLRTTVAETEPNDSASQANDVERGDTASGVIGTADDLDYFAIELEAGTAVDFDVDARVNGSHLDPILVLVDVDGVTVLAHNDDADGLDSRLRGFVIPATGRYYVVILDFYGEGSPDHTYTIRFGEQAPAPGDPTVVRPSGADAAWTMAAGATGQLYVLDWNDGDVWAVPVSGEPALVARTDGFDMALDAFGDLLVTQPDSGNIVRIATATGSLTRFTTLVHAVPLAIAVAPDGDIWVSTVSDAGTALLRFSPYGVRRDSIDTEGIFGLKLAFSPAGDLHLSDGSSTIHRLNAGGTLSPVFTYALGVGGMTFDTEGSMYVSTPASGLLKVGSDYELISDPFASSNLSFSGNSVFLRTASGDMTSRLVASNLTGGHLVEMNPAAVTAPGIRVGTDLERVTLSADEAAQALLGDLEVGVDMLGYLDGQGNGNGEFDVGDLRALVRAQAASSQATSDTDR